MYLSGYPAILIVDDNAACRAIIAAHCSVLGYRSSQAPDAAEALDLLRSAHRRGDPYGAAVIDAQMPSKPGLDLGAAIKADPTIAGTQLILLNPLGIRCAASGPGESAFTAVISKPVRKAQLCTALAAAFGKPAQTCSGNAGGTPVSSHPAGTIRVLVVEDNTINQYFTVALLKKLGYEADPVANGAEAIAALKNIPYHLVLMDCQMPQMDGYEATRRIRAEGSDVLNRNVPILGVTANALQGDRDLCIAAGMNDYLAKPVSKRELAAMLDKWLVGMCRSARGGNEK